MLNRDFEEEQQTGICSYCHADLRYIVPYENEDGYYESCPSCDEYDDWGWIDDYPEGKFE